jgi:hypothetical protein
MFYHRFEPGEARAEKITGIADQPAGAASASPDFSNSSTREAS